MPKMAERSAFDALLVQARVSNCLLAALLRLHMNQTEIVALLKNFGLTAREVADILGTSPATIAVTRSRIRQRQQEESTDAETTEVEVPEDGIRDV